jgi:hypothetical protein
LGRKLARSLPYSEPRFPRFGGAYSKPRLLGAYLSVAFYTSGEPARSLDFCASEELGLEACSKSSLFGASVSALRGSLLGASPARSLDFYASRESLRSLACSKSHLLEASPFKPRKSLNFFSFTRLTRITCCFAVSFEASAVIAEGEQGEKDSGEDASYLMGKQLVSATMR